MKVTPRKLVLFLATTSISFLFFHVFFHLQLDHSARLPVAIKDNLPLKVITASDLPPIPKPNLPPEPHLPCPTPLLIGFSQNWPMLQQAIVSYLVAGWPASDIFIIDNTGTMFSNRRAQLSIQNPSFLDYHRLEKIYNVNIIMTPTRLSFSQLQNFFLHEALVRDWTHYFWSHMDVVALSTIDPSNTGYQSLYRRVVADLEASTSSKEWAIRFYAYDRLAVVSVAAFDSIGGWDTSIPYYSSDCDVYGRLNMAGYNRNPSPDIGQIFDVATAMEDVTVLFLAGSPYTPLYDSLYYNMSRNMEQKNKAERNTWQAVQQGGQGEPYYYKMSGWEIVRTNMIEVGRKIFRLKWGTSQCRLYDEGVRESDLWKSRSWWWFRK